MESTGKIIAGVLAGVAAGAVLGILFAPGKGSETRERIADSLKNMSRKIKDSTGEFISEQGAKLKSQAQQLADKTSKAMS